MIQNLLSHIQNFGSVASRSQVKAEATLEVEEMAILVHPFAPLDRLKLHWIGDEPAGTKETEKSATWSFSRRAPASSEVTAPDEPIEIPPVQVYVPKVPYPIPPKHLMDPISAEQLAGFTKLGEIKEVLDGDPHTDTKKLKERTEQPASSEVTAPDELIEIPPVRVYVPKVPYPIPPKHLMDPISAEQLAGYRKMWLVENSWKWFLRRNLVKRVRSKKSLMEILTLIPRNSVGMQG
ncbi:hypothetical protein DY000_02005392 [Brassica cretica]|uniref:Uncharacterized protein n=1 Tax=Brassica cretica TaxID=69181 RepID=A0ABQ7C7P3_BRACR|nr:hypothetical protein DY000_02005392 [Brassica cretica]